MDLFKDMPPPWDADPIFTTEELNEKEREEEGEQTVSDVCICNECMKVEDDDEPQLSKIICCGLIPKCEDILKKEDKLCITQTEAFHVACLNETVLDIAHSNYSRLDRLSKTPGGKRIILGSNPNRRYTGYRQFAEWMKTVGRRRAPRRPLPTCVVWKIRETFPSTSYTGFKEASDFSI